jgi:hypothetical protein
VNETTRHQDSDVTNHDNCICCSYGFFGLELSLDRSVLHYGVASLYPHSALRGIEACSFRSRWRMS